MERLSELFEALLMSLAVVGTAALQMLLFIWLIFAAFVAIALLRWGVGIVWNSAVAAYRRGMRRG